MPAYTDMLKSLKMKQIRLIKRLQDTETLMSLENGELFNYLKPQFKSESVLIKLEPSPEQIAIMDPRAKCNAMGCQIKINSTDANSICELLINVVLVFIRFSTVF